MLKAQLAPLAPLIPRTPVPQDIAAGGNPDNPYAANSAINSLSRVVISNSTIDASSLPDLSGNYLSTAGGSVSGTLTANIFAATSTTATSSFAGGATFAINGGNVGIGTIDPAHTLTVNGDALFTGMPQVHSVSGDVTPIYGRTANDGLTVGAWNILMDGTSGDLLHLTTGSNTSLSRSVTDAVTTSGSSVITSATANFSAGVSDAGTDIGMLVSGAGIPSGTTILSVQSSTQATLSAKATASGTNVSLTFGAGNPNGGLIAMGVDNGGTGLIVRNKWQGIGVNLQQLSTVASAQSYAMIATQFSNIAPLIHIVAGTSSAATLLQLTSSQTMNAGTLLASFNANTVGGSSLAGQITADTGLIDWRRTIQTVAPNSSVTPLIRVADEATNPTETYIDAKTNGETGLHIYRWSGTSNLMYSSGLFATSDRLKLQVGNGAQAKGSETMSTVLEARINATPQLGFFGVTPVSQPSNTTDLRTALINLGLLASGGANPLNLNGGAFVAGSVGVGTTSPYALLSVANSASTPANTPLFVISSSTAAFATTTLLTVSNSGNVGIGTANPSYKLDVSANTSATTGGSNFAQQVFYSAAPASAANANYIGLFGETNYNSSFANSAGAVVGVRGEGFETNALSGSVVGLDGVAVSNSSDTSGLTTSLYGGRFQSQNTGTGRITHAIGFKVNSPVNNGTVDIEYGGYIAAISGGTQNSALHIEGAGPGNAITFSGNGSASLDSKIYSSNVNELNIEASSDLLLNTLGGNVGIGTTSPFALLSISNLATTAANTPLFAIASTTGGTATTTVLSVSSSGNLTIVGSAVTCTIGNGSSATNCSASDRRLKDDITPLVASTSLAAIDALNPVSFQWNSWMVGNGAPTSTQLGFIAQEVAPIFGNLVSQDPSTGYFKLDYQGFFAPIVGSIQALSAQLTALADTVSGFALNIVSAHVSAAAIDADSLTVNKQLCATRSDGSSVCVTGDQLANILQGSGGASAAAPAQDIEDPSTADASTTGSTGADAASDAATSSEQGSGSEPAADAASTTPGQ